MAPFKAEISLSIQCQISSITDLENVFQEKSNFLKQFLWLFFKTGFSTYGL